MLRGNDNMHFALPLRPERAVDSPVSMTIAVKIKIVQPPPGVLVGVQSGKGSAGRAHGVQRTDGKLTSFEVVLDVRAADPPKFGGPFVQSDSKGQFIYLRWGQSAGDHFSPWQRRAKLYLHQVTRDIVLSAIETGQVPTLVIAGTARDGGPACPTVPVTLELPAS